jgi:hypothetical protein
MLQADKARKDHMSAFLPHIIRPCEPPEHRPKVNGHLPEDTRNVAQATLYRILNTAQVMAPEHPSLNRDMHGFVTKPQHWKDPEEGTPLHKASATLFAEIDQREVQLKQEPRVQQHLLCDGWAVRLAIDSVDPSAAGAPPLLCHHASSPCTCARAIMRTFL